MRKDKLYLLTFVSLSLVFMGISGIAIRYFVNEAAENILETHLEFSKREAKQIALLIGSQINNGITKETTLKNTQKSIESNNLESGFITVFDWSGKIVCHPDIKQLDQTISSKKSFITSVSDEVNSKDFYKLLQEYEDKNHSANLDFNKDSEVIYLYPVSGTDWIVGAHANTKKIAKQIKLLRTNFQIILLIMGLLFILASVVIVRIIGSNYEKNLELKNEKLSNEIINLSKLNSDLDLYKQQVFERSKNKKETDTTTKKRILTYKRNELVPVSTEDIAYVYTDIGITYIVCFDGKRSVSNASLDELYTKLDNSYFFRANRQFIIAISAIKKIIKYGNNQLKILITPDSEVDIIISKNKAAEFKKWLNL